MAIKHELFRLLLIGICSSSLVAQTPAYHTEPDWSANGFTHMALVNDSDKTIEAFHGTQRCFNGGGEQSTDTLDFEGGSLGSMYGPDGRTPRHGVIERGGRWSSNLFLATPNTGNCDVRIDAVLFGDGTYDGAEVAVKGLKARRDGIAASVHFWMEKLSTNDVAGPTEETLHAEAIRVKAQDTAQIFKCRHDARAQSEDFAHCGYWEGKVQVDGNVLYQFDHGAKAKETTVDLPKLVAMVSRWTKKVDDNVALKRLDVTFPPVVPEAMNSGK